METRYRFFDHTADLGLEFFGNDERELYENASRALFDIMTDIGSVAVTERRRFNIDGTDRTDLLINFLREILYLCNGEGLLLRDISIVEMTDRALSVEVRGEYFDPERHVIKKEIKAVTYHRAEVKKTLRSWVGRVIFDV